MKKNNAFTLVEMLIYMGLLSILTLIFTGLFTNIIDVQLESQSQGSTFEDGNFIVSRLSYDVLRSTEVVTPNSPGQTSNALTLKINGINYQYSLNGQNMEVSSTLGTFRLNGFDTSASALSFQNISNNPSESTNSATIRTYFTLTSKTVRQKGPEVRSFRTTLGLRKKL